MSYTKDKYFSEIRAFLKKELGITNEFMIPKLDKIVLNCTSSDAAHDGKVAQAIADELMAIAGQKPVITNSTNRKDWNIPWHIFFNIFQYLNIIASTKT